MINKKQVRRFILDWLQKNRSHLGITRVSSETYDTIEAHLKNWLKDQMQRYPSVGKTFKI